MENYLKKMLVTLADAGVEFVVGGGVACVLHGVERVTLDLDVAVQMNAAQSRPFNSRSGAAQVTSAGASPSGRHW